MLSGPQADLPAAAADGGDLGLERASFGARGYGAGEQPGAIRPLEIAFEPEFEDANGDVVSRLDELGRARG